MKGPVTYIYIKEEEDEYLFSSYPLRDYFLLTCLPGIHPRWLQKLFAADKLANGWYQNSDNIIDFLVNIYLYLLGFDEREAEPPSAAFMNELDNLLKEKGISR